MAARERRREDERACRAVGARTVWLPFGDESYERRSDEAEVWERIAEVIHGATAVLTPGFPLLHPDHAWLTRLVLANRDHEVRVGLYLEQPYATSHLMGRSRRRGNASSLAEGFRYLAQFVLTRGTLEHGRGPTVPNELCELLPAMPTWQQVSTSARDQIVKHRAIGAYASQRLGPFCRTRISLYEAGLGGESLVWLPSR
jgi:LmbE family N-acetylglucosaminyl deacetylase